MKIKNVKLISSDKRTRTVGGLYVDFISNVNTTKGTYYEVNYEDDKHYFEVTDISTNNDNLDIVALEVGYWAKSFIKKQDFDLRKLIGLKLSKIDDTERISKIREMSCWC